MARSQRDWAFFETWPLNLDSLMQALLRSHSSHSVSFPQGIVEHSNCPLIGYSLAPMVNLLTEVLRWRALSAVIVI
jgi:hypothetical protein